MKKAELHEVLEQSSVTHPAVSLYIPQKNRPNREKIRLQLKKLASKAKRLITRAESKKEAEEILDSVESQWEYLAETHPHGGLGVFITEKEAKYVAVPWTGEELAVVSESFHTKPLIKWFQNAQKFYLLRVGRKGLNLSLGQAEVLYPVVKAPFAEDLEPTAVRGKRGRPRVEGIIEQKLIREIHKALTQVQPHLNGQSLPLIMCGRKKLTQVLVEKLNYPHLLSETLDLNPDSLSGRKLQSQAQEVLRKFQKKQRQELLEEMAQSRPIFSLQEIAKAAVHGRVESLVVAEDQQVWGQLDRKSGKFRIFDGQRNSKDEDLLDDLSEEVLKFKGQVMVLPKKEIPGGHEACAVLRW